MLKFTRLNTFLSLAMLWPVGIAAQDLSSYDLIDKVVAVVGNEPILLSEMETQLAEMKQQGIDPGPNPYCSLLEELLLQKLYLNQAMLDSLEVSDEQVQAEVDRRMNFYIEQLGSISEFEKFYGKPVSEFKQEFFEPVKEQELIKMMRSQVASSVNITPKDVREFFSSMPKDSLPLIDAEVQYSQIVIYPEVQQKEKDRTMRFLDSLRQDIISGKTNMAAQALLHSQDPGSKFKGGCYDFVRRGNFVPEYEAAVYNTEEGGFSQVFQTKFGYHFVYVEEKRGEFFKSCHILMRPTIKQDDVQRARVKMDSVITLLARDSISFEKAAIRFSGEKESANQGGKVINPYTLSSKHRVNDLEPDVFFILDELDPGEVSRPSEYQTPEGTTVWRIIRLDNRIDAHKANLKDDYMLLKNLSEQSEEQRITSEWIQEAIERTYIRIDESFLGCDFGFQWLLQ
jgi:peptidyl-prolyl cis-trans isomerase SurA